MTVKYGQSANKTLTLFVFAAAFALIPASAAACLPAEDVITIYDLEDALNLTGHPLYNIMEAMCQRTLNATAPDLSEYPTRAEIEAAGYVANASMNDFVTYSVMDTRISSAMAIISQANVEERVDAAMQNYTDSIEAKFSIDQLLWYVVNNTEKLIAGTNTTSWASQTDIQNVNSYIQSHESRLSSLEAQVIQQTADTGFNPAWIVGGIALLACGAAAWQFYLKPKAEASRYPHIATVVPEGAAANFDEDEASRSLGVSMISQMGLGGMLKKKEPEPSPAAAPAPAEAALSEEDMDRLAERLMKRSQKQGPPPGAKSIVPSYKKKGR